MSIQVRVLGPGDEAILNEMRPEVFDHPVDRRATREFLADTRHHLAVAIDAGAVVGFASGVHYVHPDKSAPELWVNEIGVASTHRGRGLGQALLRSLLGVAREVGCVEAWVLTDRANRSAMRLYSSLGGVEAPHDQVMFTFHLDSRDAEAVPRDAVGPEIL